MKDYRFFAEQIKAAGEYQGGILFDEPMSKHTTFRIGGTVPVFFEPADNDSLLILLDELHKNNIRFFILGGGSNIVFCDQGFDGVVLSLGKLDSIRKMESQEIKDNSVFVSAGAGCTMGQFVSFCTQNGLSGAEKFAGLPGTVGGALFMNARCFDVSVSDLFVDAYYIDLNDYTEQHISFDSADWDYKVSPFQNTNRLILNASFRLEKGLKSQEELSADCRNFTEERVSKGHFKYPSAGSVFRNNRAFGFPSGKIIDDCGLKGKQIGQAQIAPFHGNFIINLGGATQKDVKALVEFTVNEVKKKTGFTLEPEIIFV